MSESNEKLLTLQQSIKEALDKGMSNSDISLLATTALARLLEDKGLIEYKEFVQALQKELRLEGIE